jgi:acetyltransferase-like isoleucine patch superfamily enzyme
MLRPLRRLLRYLAIEHGRFRGLWVRLCQPRGDEYGEYVRRHVPLHACGRDNCILPSTDIVDPEYVRIGNDCVFSTCALIGHDASVAVLSRAFGKKYDAVGKVDIRDNCFIGYGAIVLPGVTVGPDSIVAAGALVNRDVPPGEVWGGVPAKRLCSIAELSDKLEARTRALPWFDLIDQRDGVFDPALEPELKRRRVAQLFGQADHDPSGGAAR